jgi:hypothetical protein
MIRNRAIVEALSSIATKIYRLVLRLRNARTVLSVDVRNRKE